ncbi:MAG: HlyD family type I secretion periplasmic adaptor subunit [Rhodospirillaceae bacterium]|nr:HlyD family type I secretion periplasmic adaptor subunit [Rhodospirillaceae bacterium]MBT6310343.1 HlyD family type I secretion periplasmic adaptor subunit [Rhodospirillaceae bacterium]MBT7363465.1 HlyD family type I secretion periplasmic adaptor subunit [Rhodospirillaceae bacterium]
MAQNSNPLKDLAERQMGLSWRMSGGAVALLLLGALGWASIASLDEVSIAEGEVVPQGQVRLIQHLEGGIIKALFVEDSALVKAGQPLVELDLASGGTNREELQVRIDGLVLKRARLAALATETEPSYPSDSAERHPQLVLAENEALSLTRAQLESRLASAGGRVDQRGLEVAELEARRRAFAASLPLVEERFRLSLSLLEEELTPRMEHLERERELEVLKGEIDSLRSNLPRAKSALAEAEEGAREISLEFRRAISEQITLVELEIAREQERLVKATEQRSRAVISSPIEGVVQNLAYHTIGGVVGPGDSIMQIVPSRERLLIEARVDPRDIGHVEVGQRAVAKVSTYDFVRYGGLEGRVVSIAADADTDRSGQHYFRVVVETTDSALGADGSLPIIPGMQATIDIHTGEKRVLDYLIQPVLKTRSEAFRER